MQIKRYYISELRNRNKLTDMYFLRFTENPEADLERGQSYHYDDDGNKYEVGGLCGFELEAETLEEAIEEVKEFSWNYVYNFKSMGDIACIFTGEDVDTVPDGDVFEAEELVWVNK